LKKDCVFLVGMPGSGKSVTGRHLAKSLGWTFVDLDHEIVKAAGKSIPWIFSNQGEARFRRLETQALRKAARGGRVVATGGGVVKAAVNWRLMQSRGLVAGLKTTQKLLVQRLRREAKGRPLLAEGKLESKIRLLVLERGALYRRADRTFRSDGKAQDVAANIRRWLEKRGVG
jgi:shikimate kinase